MIRPTLLALTVLNALLAEDSLCQEIRREAVAPDVSNPPAWLRTTDFGTTQFVFARARYKHIDWATDYPDADLNFVAKLETLTSLSTACKVADLDHLDAGTISLLYFSRAGSMQVTEREARSIRSYLEDGGFAVFDDSWGKDSLAHIETVLGTIFPGRECQDLPISHPVFQCVFRFDSHPQVPSLRKFLRLDKQFPRLKVLEVAYPATYKGIFDDRGRLMAIVCHNTDTADGWECDEDIAAYRQKYSDRVAYPLGVNIVHVALTE